MENVPGSRLHCDYTSVTSESNSTLVGREGCVTVSFPRNIESSERRQKRKVRKEEEEEEIVIVSRCLETLVGGRILTDQIIIN